MDNTGVSIIICCYNSSLRIEKTLAFIAAQVINNINCEVILVDNASTDDTASIAASAWKKMHAAKIGFNVVHEPNPGLSQARLMGIASASYEYLIFCDDDNWLDENYVLNTFNILNANVDTAVLGGFGTAEFENPSQKPGWFDTFYHSYAVDQNAGQQEKRNHVYGAGMAVRASVIKEVIEHHPLFLNDRKKNELSSGGDSEICFRIRLAGYNILYSPQLTFKHFMPAGRLTWPYLKKLHAAFTKNYLVLHLYDKALKSNTKKLTPFYWLKKALYYSAVYIKNWPKNYLASLRTGEGSVEEIHNLTWKGMAVNCFSYNFEAAEIYKSILTFKKQ